MNPSMKDKTLVYESPSGSTLEIGPQSLYRWGDTDLWDSQWTYDVDNGVVAGIRREPRESSLTIYVDAPDEDAGIAARDRLEAVLDEGVAEGRPGVLRCGEWYTRCLCVARHKDNWWFDGRYLEAELTFLQFDAKWIRETLHSFIPGSTPTDTGWLDFPFDFPFDFSPNPADRRLVSRAISACDWQITIYGPASEPYVMIGGNKYQVRATVPLGGLLKIDSRDWTVVVRDVDGDEVDMLDRRIRGAEGSGEYMWQKVPSGASVVSWDETFGWDIVLYEEA